MQQVDKCFVCVHVCGHVHTCTCLYRHPCTRAMGLSASRHLPGWAQQDKGWGLLTADICAVSVPGFHTVSACALAVRLEIGENTAAASSLVAHLLQGSQTSGRSRLHSFTSFLVDAEREGRGGRVVEWSLPLEQIAAALQGDSYLWRQRTMHP